MNNGFEMREDIYMVGFEIWSKGVGGWLAGLDEESGREEWSVITFGQFEN